MNLYTILIAHGNKGGSMGLSLGTVAVLLLIIAFTFYENRRRRHPEEDLPAWKGGKKLKRMRFDATKTLSPDDHVRPPQQ